jgi:hypothetical protein
MLVAWEVVAGCLDVSCPIEIRHILLEHMLELPFLEDQEVIQAFATNAAEKPLTGGIRSWSSVRCSEQLDSGRCCHTRKA